MIQQKVGIGYDIHRLVEGRKLFLGGVEIPYVKGLEGHSDADVLIHAVCDALLGALGKGDIGEHFPDTDVRYHNISSLILLDEVGKMAQAQGYCIGNIDAVIQAEEPNLKKYKLLMRQAMAKQLGIDVDAINVKATTMETLGAIGQKQGIAAFATILLIKG